MDIKPTNPIDAREFFSASAIDDPYPLYTRMREAGPVCALGETRAFLVSTRAAVEEAVKRHGEFSANLESMLIYSNSGAPRVINLASRGVSSRVIATADEPDHSIHRRLMLPPLKASPVARMEPDLRTFARARIATLLDDGGGDSCATLAEPLPAYVVTRLLDLGEDALEAVRRWAMMGGDLLAGVLDDAALDTLLKEATEQGLYLFEHFNKLRARNASERGASLTATLARGVDEGLVSIEQAVGILVVLFGAAGESTAALLGSAMLHLAKDQTTQARLREEPALLANFIEEVVRLETPFKFHYRVVREETELCGTPLRQGDLLLLGWAAANRDPACFPEPDRLQLDRPNPERHLGFGYGIHFCIGAPLARLEVRVALEELLAATQRIALDADNPPEYVRSIFVRRLKHLFLKLD